MSHEMYMQHLCIAQFNLQAKQALTGGSWIGSKSSLGGVGWESKPSLEGGS